MCGYGGACVFAGGACMVVGGMLGCRGVCMVAGGVHGCRGHAWLQGVCMVAGGMCGCRGYAWLQGGMRGCQGACMVAKGHAWLRGGCIGYDKIRSMSGRYASYWNAFFFVRIDTFHWSFNSSQSYYSAKNKLERNGKLLRMLIRCDLS